MRNKKREQFISALRKQILCAFIRIVYLFAMFLLALATTLSQHARTVVAAGVSPSALSVYGQGGSLTTNTVNNGGISATSLNSPYDTRFDSS